MKLRTLENFAGNGFGVGFDFLNHFRFRKDVLPSTRQLFLYAIFAVRNVIFTSEKTNYKRFALKINYNFNYFKKPFF